MTTMYHNVQTIRWPILADGEFGVAVRHGATDGVSGHDIAKVSA